VVSLSACTDEDHERDDWCLDPIDTHPGPGHRSRSRPQVGGRLMVVEPDVERGAPRAAASRCRLDLDPRGQRKGHSRRAGGLDVHRLPVSG